jgi:hypothetical protein
MLCISALILYISLKTLFYVQHSNDSIAIIIVNETIHTIRLCIMDSCLLLHDSDYDSVKCVAWDGYCNSYSCMTY